MKPRSDGAPWWWAGPREVDRLGGAMGNIKILQSSIPFFDAPGGRKLPRPSARPGAVYPVVSEQVRGEDTWAQIEDSTARPQDPKPWLVLRSGNYIYAERTDEAPRQPTASRMVSSGWPASPAAFRSDGKCTSLQDTSPVVLETVSIPTRSGYKAVIQVAKGAGPVFAELIRWFDDSIEPVRSVGSYCHRAIRGKEGTEKASHHAAGTAIDINADQHPLGKRDTFTPEQQRLIRSKILELGLTWGGDWTGRPDDMHFEVKLDPVAFRALHARRGLDIDLPAQVGPVSAASKAKASIVSLLSPGGAPTGQALRWKEYAGFGLKIGGAALALTLGGALAIKAIRARRREQDPFVR